jgi:hypothetical protein
MKTASLVAGPQEAGPYDPSNMILSGHDSVGLLPDKECSQFANNFDKWDSNSAFSCTAIVEIARRLRGNPMEDLLTEK